MSLQQTVRDLQNADVARQGFVKAMEEFNAACIIGEWDKLDTLRLRAQANLDSYLDHLMAAHRAKKE